jgi:hypothetical protein
LFYTKFLHIPCSDAAQVEGYEFKEIFSGFITSFFHHFVYKIPSHPCSDTIAHVDGYEFRAKVSGFIRSFFHHFVYKIPSHPCSDTIAHFDGYEFRAKVSGFIRSFFHHFVTKFLHDHAQIPLHMLTVMNSELVDS